MYTTFFDLARNEKEGKDFRIVLKERESPITIVAPHGGKIEPGSSEIAQALAGEDFSYCAFEGMKESRNFETLHITSDLFDEPQCIRMVSKAKTVVTVHGCKEHDLVVRVGGRDEKAKSLITEELRHIKVRAEAGAPGQAGSHAHNICNRGRSCKGIQLEVSAGLRREMVGMGGEPTEGGGQLFEDFVRAVRKAILKTCVEDI